MKGRAFFPESSLRERIKLAYNWIPENCTALLDGGCAYGSGTRQFRAKVPAVWGIDPNPDLLAVARSRSDNITFLECGLERTPFAAEFFDAIILNDVLEHVGDETLALNEMHRILKPGGALIITTPHKGIFSFLDPDNYAYHLRTKAPGVFGWIIRRKYGSALPDQVRAGYEGRHRHYNVRDFTRMLDNSLFGKKYCIERVFRGGLFAGALASNLHEVMSLALTVENAWKLLAPVRWIADWDYFIPYGILSYNIGVKVIKTSAVALSRP
ncbi:MAG TPA: class I SAM-dependent methyltransferase [Verrucomicrobiae bacterium]